MKKRCTNSACRRLFDMDSVCPYCGKEYPRVTRRFVVVLESIDTTQMPKSVYYHRLNNLGVSISMRDYFKMVKNLPADFRSFRTKEEAAEFCLLVSISGVVLEVRDTRRNVMTAWIKDVRI